MAERQWGSIDKNSPIPLYHQINDLILQKIKEKEFLPHQQIPAEEELTAIFQVSRMTVRQAISKMVNEGILYRKRGHGTFVAEPQIERKVALLRSSIADIEEAGLIPRTMILQRKIIQASEEERKLLHLGPDEGLLEILRLRFADEQPIGIGRSLTPAQKYPSLMEADLHGVNSLIQFMEEHCGIRIAYATQKIRAVNANSYQSRLLKIKKGTSLLHMNRIFYTTEHEPIGIFEFYYRGDRYVFTSTLYK